MLILPLLLNLPEYLLMNLENQFVDEAECGSQRAATLSVLNMGVNLVEICLLYTSRMITVLFLQTIKEFSTIQQVEQLWRSWYRASRLH